MSEDPIICYCFGVTRVAVHAHFAQPDAQLKDLVAKTGITTKCTACALDFDVLLDEIHSSEQMIQARTAAEAETAGGLRERIDRVDSGLLLCNETVKTYIRLANYPPCFEGDDLCAPHRYRFAIFDDDGRVRAREHGRIGVCSEITIDLAALRNCPERGWFLLRLMPEGSGYYGTLRPQAVLEGRNWTACYHTQFHSDASREGRRSGTPIRTSGRKTRALVSIINGSMKPSRFVAAVELPGGLRESAGLIRGSGGHLLDVDAVFRDLPENASFILRIRSEQPTRKHLINLHPDGSMGVEHFPNLV